jgi:hypothetical protein
MKTPEALKKVPFIPTASGTVPKAAHHFKYSGQMASREQNTQYELNSS